jgi:hypothetical protein
VAVAAGRWHSLGLKTDGSIVGWGCRRPPFRGQCTVAEPNTGFVAIAAGTDHSLGLKADGSIVAWGYNCCGQTSVPEPNTGFAGIAAGEYHSVGLKADGSIVAWGDNSYGQTNIPTPNARFLAIAAGSNRSVAIRASCASHDDCDDGSFCNGSEVCADGTCVDGQRPCDDADGLGCTHLDATESCEEGENGPICDWCRSVVIDDCDTAVPDQRTEDGRTMNQVVADCDGRTVSHGRFVECVAAAARIWRNDNLIMGRDYARIVSCAARQPPTTHRPDPNKLDP